MVPVRPLPVRFLPVRFLPVRFLFDRPASAAILLTAEYNRTARLPLTYRPGAPGAQSAIKTTRDHTSIESFRHHFQKFTSTI
jgi:hypothetical protein